MLIFFCDLKRHGNIALLEGRRRGPYTVLTGQIDTSHSAKSVDVVKTARRGAKKQVRRLLPFHQDTNKGIADLADLGAKVHTMLTEKMELVYHYVLHMTLVMAPQQTRSKIIVLM